MTATTITCSQDDCPRGAEVPRGKRFGVLRRWFAGYRHRRRLRRGLRSRSLRRQLRRLNLDENQLNCALRAQQQLSELSEAARRQHRQLSWQLLAIVLDPEQQRPEAMQSVTKLTRDIDDKAAELIMTLSDFGAQLRDEQRETLKRWLAYDYHRFSEKDFG